MTSSEMDRARTCRLRVLVVDNDRETRDRQIELLTHWGYIPFVAEGIGDALLMDAIAKAKARRCQVALVDIRLRDNYDLADWSGLQLVPQLLPTSTIILSGFGDRKTAVAAFKEYGAADFVGREDGPEQLQATIEEVAKSISACNHHAEIIWSDGFTSADIRELLFPGREDIPADQVDEVIGRMFPGTKRVTLTLIADATEPSNRVSALRRSSCIFRVVVDDQPAFRVVKLAHVKKIERELNNYDEYVEFGMQGQFRPEKFAEALLWDVGAVTYNYMNNPGLGISGGPQTFTAYYRATESVEQILAPLRHFFADANWGIWYKKEVIPLRQSLFQAYDEVWYKALSASLKEWGKQNKNRPFIGLSVRLPNPTRWLVDHFQLFDQVVNPRKAVTHGDLHGDNLFVNKDYAWPIDFEHTGPGPILRDFVSLVQDILTRLIRLRRDELYILYELAIALCAPRMPGEPMPLTMAIWSHSEAFKAFRIIQEIQNLAYTLAHYDDRREYLWGLLLNNLFMATLLLDNDLCLNRTLLFSSVICGRLDRWNSPDWPPRDWPAVEWLTEMELREIEREIVRLNRDKTLLEAQIKIYGLEHTPLEIKEKYKQIVDKLRNYGESTHTSINLNNIMLS